MSAEVDAWMAAYDNPQKERVQRVRELILAADPRMGECIKWKAPTFTYKGNLASFFPRAKKHVSLMFHSGASFAAEHPILEGDGATARSIKFLDDADIVAKTPALQALVRAWCEAKDA
jgi:hypothetical protein